MGVVEWGTKGADNIAVDLRWKEGESMEVGCIVFRIVPSSGLYC
jgi:hypothetical protein